MTWITCSFCGPRPVEEFAFGGEQPTVPAWITDPEARDVDAAWMFANTRGPTTERWFHSAGCRRWQTIRRDTATDAVLADIDTVC